MIDEISGSSNTDISARFMRSMFASSGSMNRSMSSMNRAMPWKLSAAPPKTAYRTLSRSNACRSIFAFSKFIAFAW